MKTISVIVTTYNSSACIAKTLQSILDQEGRDASFRLEVIVADDASRDNTAEIVSQFDVRLVSNENNSGGPNKGRNIGLGISTGDFICIADHDDEWHPNRIRTLLPYLDQADIITSGYILKDEFGKEIIRMPRRQDPDRPYNFYARDETFKQRLCKSNEGQITYLGSIIFSAKYKNLHFEEHYGVVDYDWILRLFHGKASLEVCDVLYTRLVEADNLSLKASYRKKDFEYSLKTIEQYAATYPVEARIGYRRTHGSMARYFYIIGNMKAARQYFLKSERSLKTVLYYLTTFGLANWVKKRFKVFG